MILSLLLSLLTTWILYAWGDLFRKLLPQSLDPHSNFLTTYGIGLIWWCVASNVLSLVVGLNHPLLILLLCLPLLRQLPNRNRLQSLKEQLLPKCRRLQLLTGVILILLTALHAWEIKHPDSLSYQNELIRYCLLSAHPTGLVQQQNQLGYGGAWYSLSALFSFYFISGKLMTYVNLSMIGVAVFAVIKQLDKARQKNDLIAAAACLIFLGIGSYEYSFFRLALTSVAPDTPAALVGLACFLYFLNEKRIGWLLMAGCMTAVTLKLSLAPILLLPVWHWTKERAYRPLIHSLLVGILILTPFLIKNVRSTGYLIYPLPATKMSTAAYTPSPAAVQEEANFIKAYARKEHAIRKATGVEYTLSPSAKDWIPHWWNHQQPSEKTMMLASLIGLIGLVAELRKNKKRRSLITNYLFTVLVGFIFWFYQAPAVRFGAAFLLAPWVLLSYEAREQTRGDSPSFARAAMIMSWMEWVLLMIVVGYLGYRLYYFMDAAAIWWPKGPIG